jgi:hypothetical protein
MQYVEPNPREKKWRHIMQLSELSTTQLVLIVGLIVIVAAGIATMLILRKRRTARLRAQYTRVVREGGNQRRAENKLEKRAERVESFHIRALSPADHARLMESWRKVQGRFVDSPGGAVTEADQLLGDVMSLRGYPVSDFEQRAADISVDHPLVMENYRAGHEIAVRQANGKASTEELRQAMIHYRTLFEDLVGEPELARAKTAS